MRDICAFQALMEGGITLVGVRENLVDKIWTNRPPEEAKKVDVQPYKYTGLVRLKKIRLFLMRILPVVTLDQ